MPKLTKTAIDALKPGPKEQWLWDSEVPGFGVRCTPAGRRVYVARYRTHAGMQRKQVVGRCTDMSPDKARELARQLFTAVAAGQDPIAERRQPAPEHAGTVGQLFEAYVASMARRGCISAPIVERSLLLASNCAAGTLGRDTPAADVTAADVVRHLAAIFATGSRGAADKHRSYMRSAFQWAIESANDYTVAERRAWGVTQNPVSAAPRDMGATGTRDRNLSAAELKTLWQATRPGSTGFSSEVSTCIRVLIACGQRVQETLRMDGADVDLQAGVWRMPAAKTKGRKTAHVVPLPAAIIPDLRALIERHGSGPLFPARAGAKAVLIAYSSITQALDRWAPGAGLQAFQTRDIRRTWKSRAHDAGVDRFTRDLIQQHAKGDTSGKHYDRAEYLPQMREAMTKWDGWIRANLEDKPALQLVA